MAALRCFIGLPLPDAWQQSLGRLRESLAPGLRSALSWTRPGNWHLTLAFLGDVDDSRLPELRTSLEDIRFAPFMLRPGEAGFFPGPGRPRVFWLGLSAGGAEASALARQTAERLAPLGFPAGERSFHPHLTLARIRHDRGDDWPAAARAAQAWNWPEGVADQLVLWRSDLPTEPGQGPEYSELASVTAGERDRE